jgi:hypothetical protein
MSSRTYFNGSWFRSRLEARWAAFFAEVGIEYQYEPKTFPLRAGWYIPDFWLKRYNIWIEVKGDFDLYHARKYEELVNSTGNPLLVLMGYPEAQRYTATLFSPQMRFAEYYPKLTNACLAGYQWDTKTLWLIEEDRYIKMRRQWERPAKRQTPPVDNCKWITDAMRRAEEPVAKEAKDAELIQRQFTEFPVP